MKIRVQRAIREVRVVQNLRRRPAAGGARGEGSSVSLRGPGSRAGRSRAALRRLAMAGPGPGAALETPRQLLGRIRFLAEAAQSLRAGRPLPAALAFVPREVLYKLYKDPAGPSRVLLPVWEAEGLGLRVGAAGPAPGPGSGPLRAARCSIELRRGSCVRTTGEELCNGHGLWVKLTKVRPARPEPRTGPRPGRPRLAPSLPARSWHCVRCPLPGAGQLPDACPI